MIGATIIVLDKMELCSMLIIDSFEVMGILHLGVKHWLASQRIIGVGERLSFLPFEDGSVSWLLGKGVLGSDFEVVAICHMLINERLSTLWIISSWKRNTILIVILIRGDLGNLKVVFVLHFSVKHWLPSMRVISVRQWLTLLPLEDALVSWVCGLGPEIGRIWQLVWVIEAVEIIFIVSTWISSNWLIKLSRNVIFSIFILLSTDACWSTWIDLTQVWKRSISITLDVRIVVISEVIIRLVVFSDN
jgi:hypothetical protein